MNAESRLPVLVIVGTRPEAIKMLPVIRQLAASEHLYPHVLSTGQHAEAVRDVLALADLKPDSTLDLPGPERSLNELFAAILTGVEQVCLQVFGAPAGGLGPARPAWTLVHGDTTSAAAGALAAFHQHLPVAHVEAGLRTRNVGSPFPEELNRQLIARIAVFHLSPTTRNKENLILEGVRSEQVFVTGNTAIDTLRWAATLPQAELGPWHRSGRRLVVVTAHRRENWQGGLRRIGTAVQELARLHPDVDFVLPMHPNPLVRDTFTPLLDGRSNVFLTPPMPYVQFAHLLSEAYLAISDSGGVQEEAPALGTPVLVTRESTERHEGLFAGTVRLVGTNVKRIVHNAHSLLSDPQEYRDMREAENPYGDGEASRRIVAALEHLSWRTAKPPRFGSGYSRRAVLEAIGSLASADRERLDLVEGSQTEADHQLPPGHEAVSVPGAAISEPAARPA